MISRVFAALAPLMFVLPMGCSGRTPASSQDSDGSAGGAGDAGDGGDVADAPSPCTAGTATFHLSAPEGRYAGYCVIHDCSAGWLRVRAKNGEPVALELGCNTTTCQDCRGVLCPSDCVTARRMTEDGESLTWDGTYWPDMVCGANQSCRSKRCAPPGKYVAQMCAARNSQDAAPGCAVTGSVCVLVEFDYPSAVVVEGAI